MSTTNAPEPATPAPPIPPTMRAWTYTRRGPVRDVLYLDPSYPTPQLDPTAPDVLIRITHASLTPSIAHLIALLPFIRAPRPFIPELSFAGTIAAATPHTPTHLATPGTRVFGCLPIAAHLLRGSGALAEYVIAAPSALGVCPAGLPLEDAAGLDGNGQTALLMCRNGGVRRGSRVFVNGGTGGVGTTVVQVAKRVLGAAEVVATGSGEEGFALVKGLGADRVVDYRECEGGITAWLADEYGRKGEAGKFDAVLDCVGMQALFERSPAYLKERGKFVSVGAMEGIVTTLFWNIPKNRWWPRMLGGTPREFIFQQTPLTPERREELVGLVQEGKLKRVTDSVFDMKDTLGAYERLLSQRAKGKIVVKIQDA